ncbi:glutaredoxin domain-containing protein [Deinococcus marmoris]
MLEITVYTVPNCADCEAVGRLLTSQGAAFTEKNVREDAAALAGNP